MTLSNVTIEDNDLLFESCNMHANSSNNIIYYSKRVKGQQF